MARMPRLVVPGYPHHLTQRGNRHQRTFSTEDDYRHYITLLSESAHEAEIEVWAYCLMPNHLHLAMVPSTEDGLRVTLGEASDFLSNRHPSSSKA
jgi:putative transposase